MKLFVIFGLLLSEACFGQTATTSKQISCPPLPVPQAIIVIPPGTAGARVVATCVMVDVDTVSPAHVGTLIVDTTTVPPTLRAKPSTTPLPIQVDKEIPAGVVDGSNAVFTVLTAPNPSSSLYLFRNGLLQKEGLDYSISGSTITFLTGAIPVVGDTLLVSYRH